jgi:sugar phosphate isomerase/epimerase
MTWTLGYGTNGLGDHPLPQALDLIAETGYGAVALTLGFPHLDPWAEPDELHRVYRQVDALGLALVIETGTRFLLDPRRKHAPALVDAEADARVAYLRRAVQVAEELGADTVQFFSGVLTPGDDPAAARDRLLHRLGSLVDVAERHGIRLALEPEPGMVVETVADALAIRAALGDPTALGLTVDIGHCLVVESGGVAGALAAAAPALAHVQIDDMPSSHHEHRPFGDGDLDLPAALIALDATGYIGVVSVELPRHSWNAPHLLRHSHDAIARARPSAPTQGAAMTSTTPSPASTAPPGSISRIDPTPPVVAAALAPPTGWLAEAVGVVHQDPRRLGAPFALAARRVGRDALRADLDPGGVVFGTVADAARAALVVAAAPAADTGSARRPDPRTGGVDPVDTLRTLYQQGDTGERRGVLRGLDALTVLAALSPELTALGQELAADALRTNDPSLVAAATGPFAAAHLDQHTWRHAVVKLVFQQVSLDAVAGLADRADAELARMAGDLAAERRAAGRPVPDDLARIAGQQKES